MTQIKTERTRQSMSQKRLAFLAGIDARTLRKIEKGDSVSPESYRSVCNALHISPSIPVEMPTTTDVSPLSTEARSPLAPFVIAGIAFALVVFFVGALSYHFDLYKIMNLGTNDRAMVAVTGIFLFLIGCPLLGVASICAMPDTVVSLSILNTRQEMTVSKMLSAVSDLLPRGRFKVKSVETSGSLQTVVVEGYAQREDYSKLANILTTRGFHAQVRQA